MGKTTKTKLDGNQVRFGIQYQTGDVRKILYYFVQKDGSLGIGNYFSELGGAYSRRLDTTENWEISVSEAESRKKNYRQQKVSLHKSGVIVQKSKEGGRYDEQPDPISIPFEKIPDAIQAHITYPSNPEKYPKHQGKKTVNVASLLETQVPVMIKIFLSNKDFNFLDFQNRIDSDTIIFHDGNSLIKFNLDIYVVFRKSNNDFWPKAHGAAITLF